MPNRRRGEVALQLGETRYTLCLTLGALAELEDAFGVQDLMALAERFGTGRLSSRDLLTLLGVALRGGGHAMSDAEAAHLPLHDGQPQVNLSETLVRIPGVFAANRQNYAQDLQISSRGFGARAAFGVRGVRLYQDGIPVTMPDGQGQTGSFSLFSAERVEILRGPFSALYGNASGGVISVFTADPPASRLRRVERSHRRRPCRRTT